MSFSVRLYLLLKNLFAIVLREDQHSHIADKKASTPKGDWLIFISHLAHHSTAHAALPSLGAHD